VSMLAPASHEHHMLAKGEGIMHDAGRAFASAVAETLFPVEKCVGMFRHMVPLIT
jgi:hypothetical protein